MSRRGNPYDNARAERFMRTLKQEEVYGRQYRDLEDAQAQIGAFLDQVYNRQRLHSALAYQTPEEFEQQQQQQQQQPTPAQPRLDSSNAVDTAGEETNRRSDSLLSLEIPPGFPPCPPLDDDDLLYTERRANEPDRCP